MSRRGATTLRGILPIDKPAGMTSHDVVARIRRATGEGRVGHAGTLDPAATGLLVVLIGPYTRLEPYLSGAVKSYTARIAFGAATDTDDAEGAVVATAPVPAACADAAHAREALAALLGPSLQTPPAYSAIKVGGRTAHSAARAGEPLDLAARPIDVHDARLLATDPEGAWWDVAFTVSKGTYVRALARDIGRACDTVAHLSALRRTSAGNLSLDDAISVDAAVDEIAAGRIAGLFTDPFRALGLSCVEVGGAGGHPGGRLPAPEGLAVADGQPLALSHGGAFAGIYRYRQGLLEPEAVMPEEGVR